MTDWLTDWLSPSIPFLLDKIMGPHIAKFPPFHGTRRFITIFRGPHPSLYPEPHKFSPYHPIIFLQDLFQYWFSSLHVFQTQSLLIYLLFHVRHGTRQIRLPWFDQSNIIWQGVQLRKSSICSLYWSFSSSNPVSTQCRGRQNHSYFIFGKSRVPFLVLKPNCWERLVVNFLSPSRYLFQATTTVSKTLPIMLIILFLTLLYMSKWKRNKTNNNKEE